MSDPLTVEVRRLVDRLAAATPGWYAANPRGAGTRAEVLRALVADLARLGHEAGTGVPLGVAPPVLGDHALGDQLTLLAHELVAAPLDRTDDARALVRTARDRL